MSSESGPAKGVITRPDFSPPTACYCHTPMRYVWNMYQEYKEGLSAPKRWAMALLLHRMRQWDVTSAARVFITLSRCITSPGESAKILPPGVLSWTPSSGGHRILSRASIDYN